MGQLATLNIFNITRTKMKGSLYCVQLKYNNLKNSSVRMYKLFHSNPEKKVEYFLPRLMWSRHPNYSFIIEVLFNYVRLRLTVDKDFRLSEFRAGSAQALSLVSNALAAQKYEALNDIVDKKTLKILKRNIDCLTPEQRKLIAIPPNHTLFNVSGIWTLKTADKNEVIVRVQIIGGYRSYDFDQLVQFSTYNERWHQPVHSYIYVFQRRYKNGIGGSWILKLVTHETID